MYVSLRLIHITYTNLLNPRWMSKEPAEIFERAAEEGFITQASCLLLLSDTSTDLPDSLSTTRQFHSTVNSMVP